MKPNRYRWVEEHCDYDAGRSMVIVWDSVERCYYVENDDCDPIDAFPSLAEARALARRLIGGTSEETTQ